MKQFILLISICLLCITSLFSQQPDFSKLNGPYLGQRPPGITPEIFAPNIISTGLEEVLCTFSPDGDEIIFNIIYSKPHSSQIYAVLVKSYINNGHWANPEIMQFSSNHYNNMYPFISYDGKELYFQSDMPTDKPELKDKYNIWVCKKVNNSWGEAEPLSPPINGHGDVSGPSMSLSGEFYYTLMSGNPNIDGIYKSKNINGIFSKPERLSKSINVVEGSFDGVISPDGKYYIVNVYNKKSGFGETDLYVSFIDDIGNWSPLRNIGPDINTKLNEGSARVSSDGKFIFFSGILGNQNFYNENPSYIEILNAYTKPKGGSCDIYWVDASIIKDLKPKHLK